MVCYRDSTVYTLDALPSLYQRAVRRYDAYQRLLNKISELYL